MYFDTASELGEEEKNVKEALEKASLEFNETLIEKDKELEEKQNEEINEDLFANEIYTS